MQHRERLNCITHLLGLALALVGSAFLITRAVQGRDVLKIVSFGVFRPSIPAVCRLDAVSRCPGPDQGTLGQGGSLRQLPAHRRNLCHCRRCFSDAVHYPQTIALIDKVGKDIKVVTDGLKVHFNRPRP